MFQAIQLESMDNVATLVTDVPQDTPITVQSPAANFVIMTLEPVPFGHKIALTNILKGQAIVKYGRPIGRATGDIRRGGLVGVHNIEGMRGRGDLEGGVIK